MTVGGKEAGWDPHAVDAEHPCAACGRTTSHDHEEGEIERALVLREIRDPVTGFLDVRRRLTCDHFHRGDVVTEAYYANNYARCTYDEVGFEHE